jgi:hypothetical protein
MKVVVQSSSLFFTVLSILLNVPITRVKRKPDRTEEQVEAPKGAPKLPAPEATGLVSSHPRPASRSAL